MIRSEADHSRRATRDRALSRQRPLTSPSAAPTDVEHRGDRRVVIPLPHPSGASSWIHAAGHTDLVRSSLELIASASCHSSFVRANGQGASHDRSARACRCRCSSPPDHWFGSDKLKHFFMAAFTQSVAYSAFQAARVRHDRRWWAAWAVTAVGFRCEGTARSAVVRPVQRQGSRLGCGRRGRGDAARFDDGEDARTTDRAGSASRFDVDGRAALISVVPILYWPNRYVPSCATPVTVQRWRDPFHGRAYERSCPQARPGTSPQRRAPRAHRRATFPRTRCQPAHGLLDAGRAGQGRGRS